MGYKKKIVISILLIILTIFLSYIIICNNKDTTYESEKEYISEKVDDECIEEYQQIKYITEVIANEEKLSANAILILKKYYKNCDHTLNEYVELPQELVNMTEKEVEEFYNDEWEVIGFEKGKLILYKEFESACGEHFKLKIQEGKVVVFAVNDDGTESVYEKTNISSEYLTETDVLNMQDGLDIFGKEELNQIIEDFE